MINKDSLRGKETRSTKKVCAKERPCVLCVRDNTYNTIQKHVARGIVTYDLELPPRMIHSLSPFIWPVRSCRACSWPRLRGKIPAGIGITRWMSREFILHARTNTHTLWECRREDRITLILEFILFSRRTFTLFFLEFVLFLKVSSNFSTGGSIRLLYLITRCKWLLTTIMKIDNVIRRYVDFVMRIGSM